ncbi:MAG: hypothetical protein LBQ98_00045 [Nitrososphaerota archaeon]|jgi:hypothetical protein|nr:hypothetical protein [Nitrososphaerota archaeon]
MDENEITPEEMETELTQELTFHTVYAIICLYHLKPTKNIKKHYNKIPPELRKNFEKTAIDEGSFERTNDNTLVVTTKGVDMLMENILAHIDAMISFINMLKEMNEAYDDDDEDYEEEDEEEEEDYTEKKVVEKNKVLSRNIKIKEKQKNK